MKQTTLLLVGHGSRFHGGNAETMQFADQWRARHPDWPILTCFIEYDEVLLDAGLDLAAAGTRRVLVIPFILNAAGHVKMEIPAAIEAARLRHPEVTFDYARHLGMGREVLAVLQGQIEGLMVDLALPDPRTTGVILLGAAPRTRVPMASWPRWRAGSSRQMTMTWSTWPLPASPGRDWRPWSNARCAWV